MVNENLSFVPPQKGKTTNTFTTSGGGQEGWDIPNLSLAGLQTWLKLRTRVAVKPRLTADLGLDLNPRSRAVKPVAALTYQVQLLPLPSSTHGCRSHSASRQCSPLFLLCIAVSSAC